MAPHAHPPLTPFGSALAGALGSVFANAVVYPLDTVKTRLQAREEDDDDDDSDSDSESEVEVEGEGASAGEIVQRAAGETENAEVLPTGTVPKPKPQPGRASKSSAASHVQALRAYAAQRLKKWAMVMMLVRIIRHEGVSGAFHGFGASMLGTFSQQFAYFFFHSLLRSAYIRRLSARSGPSSLKAGAAVRPLSLSTSSELLLGAGAGALAQIFTIPVQVIATRQQLWRPPHHHHEHGHEHGAHAHAHAKVRAPSLMETAQEIIGEKGLTGLWTGLKPGLVLTVNPAITYGAFERLKSWRLSQRAGGGAHGKLGVGESFWLGVGSKTLATVVTYPYIFAKVRLQAKAIPDEDELAPQPGSNRATVSGGEKEADTKVGTASASAPSYASVASAPPAFGSAVVPVSDSESDAKQRQPVASRPQLGRRRSSHHPHYDDAVTLLKAVYAEHGWTGWYQGLGAQIVKAVLCQGILFVSKDQFESYAWLLIVFFSNLRKKVAA